jgi:hypothetical protein
MKKLLILILSLSSSLILARCGGGGSAFGYGLLGGFVGSQIAQPRYVQAAPTYYEDDYGRSRSRQLREREDDLEYRERRLREREQELGL